jgi:outer membrane protein assembly factor BamB
VNKFLGLLTTGVIFVMTVTPAQAQVKGDAAMPGFQELSRLGLERAWWGQAVLNPSRDKVRNVSVDEDLVYVQSTSGITTAFDAENGHQLWSAKLGKYDQPTYAPVSSEKLALVIAGQTLFAIQKRTGKTEWVLELDGLPSTGPALDDQNLYFGTVDGRVFAYSLRKIRRLYEERRLPTWSREAQVWMFRAAKEITSPPIPTLTSEGVLISFGSEDGSLYTVKAENRVKKYQMETDKAIVAAITRLNTTLYVASEDYSFYAVDIPTGRIEWEFTSGLPIRKNPWAVDKDLFLLPERGGMFCLDPITGKQRWGNRTIQDFVALVGDRVAATDDTGSFVMLNHEDGKVVGSLPMRNFNVRSGNDRTDRIILATDRGLVLCLRPIGHEFPVYHRYPERLPLLPEFEPEEGETASQ